MASVKGETNFPCDLNKPFHLRGRGMNNRILLVAGLKSLCSQMDFLHWQWSVPSTWSSRTSQSFQTVGAGLQRSLIMKCMAGEMICLILSVRVMPCLVGYWYPVISKLSASLFRSQILFFIHYLFPKKMRMGISVTLLRLSIPSKMGAR